MSVFPVYCGPGRSVASCCCWCGCCYGGCRCCWAGSNLHYSPWHRTLRWWGFRAADTCYVSRLITRVASSEMETGYSWARFQTRTTRETKALSNLGSNSNVGGLSSERLGSHWVEPERRAPRAENHSSNYFWEAVAALRFPIARWSITVKL